MLDRLAGRFQGAALSGSSAPSVVRDYHQRQAAQLGEMVEYARQAGARQRRVDHERRHSRVLAYRRAALRSDN